MNILDLAAMVTVRNHINTVMNDKSVSSKEDFKPLNEARVKLDKKFISDLKELDIDTLLSNVKPLPETEIVVSNSLVKEDVKDNVPEQLSLSLEIVDKPSLERTYTEGVSSAISEEVDDEAADLALIAERVKAQKEQLKKEGRSNRLISKAKNDAPGQK